MTMVTRPSGSLGGALYDAFDAVWAGAVNGSIAVGLDPSAFLEQFHVPLAFSLMPLGAGSMLLDQIGI